MQSEVPVYLSRFRNSRGKSCPRSPLLLDLPREIFLLPFHAALMSLKPSGFTAAERWREHSPELYPATDLPGGEEGKPKAPCRWQCLKKSCLRVWFQPGTHDWLSAHGCSCCQPSRAPLGCWMVLLRPLRSPPALRNDALSTAHPRHRGIPYGKWLGALGTESA